MHQLIVAPRGRRSTILSITRESGRFSDEPGRARKNNPDFGELAGLRIDLDRAHMLLYNNVVSDGQTKAGALSSRFCCEERIEHLVPDLGRNAGAVVANPYLHAVAEALGRGREGGLISSLLSCCLRLVAA